jgi:acetoin utilization deacetylase AcuC-like enzyme
MARTGLVYRKECLGHVAGVQHPERPERLKAIVRALAVADLKLKPIPCEPASREALRWVHSEDHIALIKRTCATNGIYPDVDTGMVKASWPAALLAAGGAMAACKAVLDGAVDNAFCAIRPPGHHAERDRAMGFCLFNNVAVAAQWLRKKGGVKRVAILDWDVHHGNGTQHAFYDDDTVYYASLHEHPLFPGTGDPKERGKNNTNLNIRMPSGSGPKEWLAAVDGQVLPELERFKPDFLLISAGFDAHRLDTLASQRLEAETYAQLTRRAWSLARGRIVSILEGGYHLEALGECAVAHVKALQDA